MNRQQFVRVRADLPSPARLIDIRDDTRSAHVGPPLESSVR